MPITTLKINKLLWTSVQKQSKHLVWHFMYNKCECLQYNMICINSKASKKEAGCIVGSA